MQPEANLNACPYDEQPHGLCLPGIDLYAENHSSWLSECCVLADTAAPSCNDASTTDIAAVAATALDELIAEASRLPLAVMCVGKQEAQVLYSLARMSRARRILELGTFSGYSAISLAGALPLRHSPATVELECQVTTVDNWSDVPEAEIIAERHIDRFNATVASLFRELRSPVIRMIRASALDALRDLAEVRRSFDFVFLDADKEEQISYYEELLRIHSDQTGGSSNQGFSLLARPHGVICVDNTLWYGKAAQTSKTSWDSTTQATHAFNEHVLADERTTNVILTVRDGLTIIQWR